jgi:hypothetical protein
LGKINGKWLFHGAMGDHDLTDAPGAPCTGIFDVFAFMIAPLAAYFHLWPYQDSFTAAPGGAKVHRELVGGNPFGNSFPFWFPFPNILPPTIVMPPTGGVSF